MWCDGEDAGHWVDIDSFAAEAEEAAVEAWRVAVVARIPRLVSRKGRQAPTSPLYYSRDLLVPVRRFQWLRRARCWCRLRQRDQAITALGSTGFWMAR